MNKLLTIFLPTYNRRNRIEQQLNFLKSEVNADVLQNVRFIASDNCSTDGSATFLKDFAASNQWLEYVVQKENLGLVGNLNAGLKMADTEFIWFMSDDDPMENGVVDKVLHILRKFNGGAIYSSFSLIMTALSGISRILSDLQPLVERGDFMKMEKI
jgi:glycosyltransferase involved in cell wall biosynthesis